MIILILIGIVPCLLATNVVVQGYEERAVSLREMNVKNQCEILCAQLISEDYFENPSSPVVNSGLSVVSNLYNGRITIVNDDFRVIKDTFDIDTGKTSVSKEVINCFEGEGGEVQYDARNAYILMTLPIRAADSTTVRGVMVVSISTNEIVQNMSALESQGLMVTVAVLCMAVALILAGMALWNRFKSCFLR